MTNGRRRLEDFEPIRKRIEETVETLIRERGRMEGFMGDYRNDSYKEAGDRIIEEVYKMFK